MTRKPLVQVDGQLSELPATDSLSMATPALPVVIMTAAQISTLNGVITLTASNFPDTLILLTDCEVYLPSAATVTGRRINIVMHGNLVSMAPVVYPYLGENFAGVANTTAISLKGPGDVLTVVSDGTAWRVINHDIPGAYGDYYYNFADGSPGFTVDLSTFSDVAQHQIVDGVVGDITLLLPLAQNVHGRAFTFIRVDTGDATVATLAAQPADQLDKVTSGTFNLQGNSSVTLLALYGEWVTISKYSAVQDQQQVYVQSYDPGLADGVPALWVQTNVGGDPTKFSLWFNQ